jgi:hypothetical protein
MKNIKTTTKAAQASKSAMNDSIRFTLSDENGNIFERGQMPPELYDRACRAAEEKGVTVAALFESAIKKAAEALPA